MPGEILAVIGDNGAASSLIKALSGDPARRGLDHAEGKPRAFRHPLEARGEGIECPPTLAMSPALSIADKCSWPRVRNRDHGPKWFASLTVWR